MEKHAEARKIAAEIEGSVLGGDNQMAGKRRLEVGREALGGGEALHSGGVLHWTGADAAEATGAESGTAPPPATAKGEGKPKPKSNLNANAKDFVPMQRSALPASVEAGATTLTLVELNAKAAAFGSGALKDEASMAAAAPSREDSTAAGSTGT